MAITQETSVPDASYLYLQNAENIELDRSPCGDRKWFIPIDEVTCDPYIQ